MVRVQVQDYPEMQEMRRSAKHRETGTSPHPHFDDCWEMKVRSAQVSSAVEQREYQYHNFDEEGVHFIDAVVESTSYQDV